MLFASQLIPLDHTHNAQLHSMDPVVGVLPIIMDGSVQKRGQPVAKVVCVA